MADNILDSLKSGVSSAYGSVENLFSSPSTNKTRTQALASKLSGADDKRAVKQVIYPPTIMNGLGNGHFILINVNRLKGSSYQDKANRVENESEVVTSGYDQPVFYTRGYSIQGQLEGGGRYVRSNESIILSMPDSLATSYGMDWNAVELGLAGKLAREISSFDQNTVGDIVNALGEGLKNAAAGALESLTGINVKQTAELYTGTIQNPFLEVLFKGARTRDHSFSFKFMPRNREEALTIAEIKRRLKFHMHPEFKYRENDSSYFLYPSTFDITFMKVENGAASRNIFMHRINTCALVGLEDDPAPNGPSFHKDNTPAAHTLKLNFIELAPLKKTDFESVEDSF